MIDLFFYIFLVSGVWIVITCTLFFILLFLFLIYIYLMYGYPSTK